MWKQQTVKEKELLENCKWFWNKTESIIEKKVATQSFVDCNACDGGDNEKIKFMRLNNFANDTVQKITIELTFGSWLKSRLC